MQRAPAPLRSSPPQKILWKSRRFSLTLRLISYIMLTRNKVQFSRFPTASNSPLDSNSLLRQRLNRKPKHTFAQAHKAPPQLTRLKKGIPTFPNSLPPLPPDAPAHSQYIVPAASR